MERIITDSGYAVGGAVVIDGAGDGYETKVLTICVVIAIISIITSGIDIARPVGDCYGIAAEDVVVDAIFLKVVGEKTCATQCDS